jgi:hypothetical protein
LSAQIQGIGAARRHTIKTGVVRLRVNLLDLSILKNQSITLASWTAEDSSAIKGQVKSFGELGSWVSEEANLWER